MAHKTLTKTLQIEISAKAYYQILDELEKQLLSDPYGPTPTMTALTKATYDSRLLGRLEPEVMKAVILSIIKSAGGLDEKEEHPVPAKKAGKYYAPDDDHAPPRGPGGE